MVPARDPDKVTRDVAHSALGTWSLEKVALRP